MAWMRCVLTGGEYRPAAWQEIEAGRWPELSERSDGWVISLVPTQLERLLRQPETGDRLRRFRCIFLGGAPAWPELLEQAAAERLPLSVGYGMTETAAMATALRPQEFLAGRRGSGGPLPHVRVQLEEGGRIVLHGESIFRGYYPDWDRAGCFATEDLGELDRYGQLTVHGRRDGVIITGGEKVRPEEVEAILRGTGQFADVAVLGVPDARWGEQVVAAYAAGAAPDWERVRAAVEARLASYKRPKDYVALAPWPRNAQGKLNRPQLREAVATGLRAGGKPQPG
jgi:O-succinylbenzoic acid--CoA ligase